MGDGDGRELYRVGDAQDQLRCLSHAVFLLLGAVVVASLLVGVTRDGLGRVGLTEETAPVLVTGLLTALNLAGLLLAGLLYLAWRDDRSIVRLRRPTPRDGGWVLLGSVALAALVTGLGRLADTLGFETADNVAVEVGREHPELFLVFVPIQFLLTAPAEELLFRGLVQGLFRSAYGVVPAVLMASALFAMIHYTALAGSEGVWVVIAILAATGLLLGTVYEYTENLLVPVFIHANWNAALFLFLYVQAA